MDEGLNRDTFEDRNTADKGDEVKSVTCYDYELLFRKVVVRKVKRVASDAAAS